MAFKGLPFVIAGPSGSGKTTLSQLILDSSNKIVESVSFTTRPPRKGEEDGVHYNFVNDIGFKKLIDEDGLLEWSNVHGFMYGTSASWVDRHLEGGRDVLFVLDLNGAEALRERSGAVIIFIVPPDFRSLEERLIRRGTDDPGVMSKRLASAPGEMARGLLVSDYVVRNSRIETALGDILAIIRTEHISRISRAEIAKSVQS